MQILTSGNYTSYIFKLLYIYYLAQSQRQLYSIIIFVRTCVHFFKFILNRLARKILPGKKFQVKQKLDLVVVKTNQVSNWAFIYVQGEKKAAHILLFMYERKEKPVRGRRGKSHVIFCSDQCTKQTAFPLPEAWKSDLGKQTQASSHSHAAISLTRDIQGVQKWTCTHKYKNVEQSRFKCSPETTPLKKT